MQLHAGDAGDCVNGKPRCHRQYAFDVATVHERDIDMKEPVVVAGYSTADAPLDRQVRIELLTDLREGDRRHHRAEPRLLVKHLTGTGADIQPVAEVSPGA